MSEIAEFIDNIFLEIIGKTKKSNIVKINGENLSNDGDFRFPLNILAWRGLIASKNDNKSVKNILDYYLNSKGIDTINLTNEEITKQGIDLLVEASGNWSLRIEKGCQRKERICLFLNRSFVIKKIIREALKSEKPFKKLLSTKKKIFLKVNDDAESNLTTLRLEKLRRFAERILVSQGYEISQDSEDKFVLTTKSQGKSEEGYRKYVCGVVKNPVSGVKETAETYDSYLQAKINELEELNEGRESGDGRTSLKRIAEAIVTFELLGVRPSRPSFIDVGDSDRTVASTKGGSFVLYNSARIEAILGKFEEECLARRYPEIFGIDEVDFDRLSLELESSFVAQEISTEEEYGKIALSHFVSEILSKNFKSFENELRMERNQKEKGETEWLDFFDNILKTYPHVLMNSVQYEDNLELSPQYLCTFLSHLSQKFSVYYRRTRILTEGREHLIPTMMARLYLLKALQAVINNALEILDITSISRM